MTEAMKAIMLKKGLRGAGKEYGALVAAFKQWLDGTIPVDTRPDLATVLTREEEERLCKYCMDMCDKGYGMSIKDIRTESSGRAHPFKGSKAGRDWYASFM